MQHGECEKKIETKKSDKGIIPRICDKYTKKKEKRGVGENERGLGQLSEVGLT